MTVRNKAELLAESAIQHPIILNPDVTGTNVLTKEEYTELAKFVFDQIVTILSKSYGPYGSMTLINRAGYRFSTKDGWRILRHIQFNGNPYYQAIHRMIFEVCEQMNNRVGDGTTTVILMANRIYNELIDKSEFIDNLDIPPRDLFHAFDEVVDLVIERLKKKARPFTPDKVRQIASIATNDNKEIVDCLCELYERDPNADIQILESNKVGVSVEKINGLKIPVNLVDRIYINNKADETCDLKDNALYMVFNHKVSDVGFNIILECETAAKKIGKRLVVIAPAYDENILTGYWRQRVTEEYRVSGTNTTVLTLFSVTTLGLEGASDLAILLDTSPIDANMIKHLTADRRGGFHVTPTGRSQYSNQVSNVNLTLGRCESAKLSCKNQSFFCGLEPTPNLLDAQVAEVQKKIEDSEDNMTVTEKAFSVSLSGLKKRLARLSMKMSAIYYGANTGFEKEYLHDTIEDGVRALESAREFGIVNASQYDLLYTCKEIRMDLDPYVNPGVMDPEDIKEDIEKLSNKALASFITTAFTFGLQNMLKEDLYAKSNVFVKTWKQMVTDTDVILPEGSDISLDPIPEPEDPSRDIQCDYAMRQGVYQQLSSYLPTEDVDVVDGNPVFRLLSPLNMITMKKDPSLIVSAETDICALRASIELLKILIAGNQLMMVNE